MGLISDSDPSVNEVTAVGQFLSHYPSGSSLKCLQHLTQTSRSCEFSAFDYGEEKNMEIYDSDTPPVYDPSRIKTPVALFVGEYDLEAPPESVEWLVEKLSTALVHYDLYPLGHVGFFMAKDPEYLFDVEELLEKYATKQPTFESKYD